MNTEVREFEFGKTFGMANITYEQHTTCFSSPGSPSHLSALASSTASIEHPAIPSHVDPLGVVSLVEPKVVTVWPSLWMLSIGQYATLACSLFVAARFANKYLRSCLNTAIEAQVNKAIDAYHSEHQRQPCRQRRRHLLALANSLSEILNVASRADGVKHLHRVGLGISRACALLELIRAHDADDNERDRNGSILRCMHDALKYRLSILANDGYATSSRSADYAPMQGLNATCGLIRKWLSTGIWDRVLEEWVVFEKLLKV